MTSAALQAACLDALLTERKGELKRIAWPYFRRVARLINNPWQMAVGEDFRFPQTKGKKRIGTDLINAYMTKVHRVTHTDATVGKAFFRVLNMMEPPTSLMKLAIVWRVLDSSLRKRNLLQKSGQGVSVAPR